MQKIEYTHYQIFSIRRYYIEKPANLLSDLARDMTPLVNGCLQYGFEACDGSINNNYIHLPPDTRVHYERFELFEYQNVYEAGVHIVMRVFKYFIVPGYPIKHFCFLK